jgi:tellurite methyltransferase
VPDWDERYRRGEHDTLEPSRLLAQAIDILPPGRALDLACGAGRHAIFLAERGWSVTAVDSSPVAIEITRKRAQDRGLEVETVIADLERSQFVIEPDVYDLIAVFYYLQRDLFPSVRAGVKAGGTVVAAIHLVDEDPASRLANPAFSLQPGELCVEFAGWEIIHYHEGQPHDRDHKRRTAEMVARKPME